jgi:hypothetical protein
MTFEARTVAAGAVIAMLAAHRREWVRRHDESVEARRAGARRRVEVDFELPGIAWAAARPGEPLVVPLGLRRKEVDSAVEARDEDGAPVAVLPRAWGDELAAAGLVALAVAAGAETDDSVLLRLAWRVVGGDPDEAGGALAELAAGETDATRRAWMHAPFRSAARSLADHRPILVALSDCEGPRALSYEYEEPPEDVAARDTWAVRFGAFAALLASLLLSVAWLAAPALDDGPSPALLLVGVPAVLCAYLAARPEPSVPSELTRVRRLLLVVTVLSLGGEALLATGASTAVVRIGGGLLALASWGVAALLLETRRRALGGGALRLRPAPVDAPQDDGEPRAGDERRPAMDATHTALLALAMGAGLMVVALADSMARDGTDGAQAVFWLGLLAIFVPAVGHAWRGPPRVEAVVAVVMLGVSLYLVKVLHSPLEFTFHDEFSTLRTTLDIERFGSLFEPNPLIEVHPVYPGLELVSSALSSLTGLSAFAAGLVVIGVMRVALMAALFLVFEAVASTRVAALGTVLYASNPNFVFFDSQWAYESFALPLALVVVALAAQGRRSTWLAVPVVLALCVSHPLTSIAVIAFLAVWAGVDTWTARHSGGRQRSELWILAATGAAGLVLWVVFVARGLGGYLGPVLGDAGNSFVDLLLGQAGSKRLFGGAGVADTPIGERLLGYAAVLLALAAVGFGVRLVWHRLTPLAATLALTALVYPLSLPLRLTEAGTEISNRASEFVFVGVAVLGALALTEYGRGRRSAVLAVPAVAAVALVGGVIIGTAPWSRLPGEYEVVADESSVEPEGMAAASWARRELGPGNRIFTDRVNGLMMGSIGLQEPQVGEVDGRPLPKLLTAPLLDDDARFIVSADRIGYLVADRRIATAPPAVGFYFTRHEPGAYRHKRPIELDALVKWDLVCPVGRVFDSGHLIVYDTRRMSVRGECPVAAREEGGP